MVIRQRFTFRCLAAVAFVWALQISSSTAEAQWVTVGPTYYAPAPVVAYRPVVVTAPAVVPVGYTTYYSPSVYAPTVSYYSPGYSPYPFGGYGIGRGYAYGVEPRVVRDRYNYGLFGHYNYHHVARGPGFGRYHYHARSPGFYGYSYWW